MKKTIAALIILAGLALSAPAELVVIEWEGEDFDGGLNLAGYSFGTDPCMNASDGFMLMGLDWPGEYVDYWVELPCDCDYTPSICVQGFLSTTNTLRMTFVERDDPGMATESIFTFAGEGYGCGSPFVFHEGNGDLPATAGSWIVRIELVSSDPVWIDVVRLEYDDTPVAAGSWSLLRRLY